MFYHDAAGMLVLQVAQDFAQAEDAHAERHEVQPVGHFRHVEGEALRAGFHVAADQTEQQAQHDHREGLEQRAAGQSHGRHEAEHHQREILRRAELERHLASGGAASTSSTVATVPAKKEPSAAVASAGPARPCLAIW